METFDTLFSNFCDMFSSLPSASKIYLSSAKPKQKGPPVTKRKRKKGLPCSPSADSQSEETLVSRAGVSVSAVSSRPGTGRVSLSSRLSGHAKPTSGNSSQSHPPRIKQLAKGNSSDLSDGESLNNDRDSPGSDVCLAEQNQCDHTENDFVPRPISPVVQMVEVVDDVLLPESQQTLKTIDLNDQNFSSESECASSDDNLVITVVADDATQSSSKSDNEANEFTQTETKRQSDNNEHSGQVLSATYKVGCSLLGENLNLEACDSSSVRSDCCMSTEIYQEHVVTSEHSSLDENDVTRLEDLSPKQSEISNTESMCNVNDSNVQCASETGASSDQFLSVIAETQCDKTHDNPSSILIKRNIFKNSHSIGDLRKPMRDEQLQHSFSLPGHFPMNTTYSKAQGGIFHCACCEDRSCNSKSSSKVHQETSTLDLGFNSSDVSASTSEFSLKDAEACPVTLECSQEKHRRQGSIRSFQEAQKIIMKTIPPVTMLQARSRSYVFGTIGRAGSLLGNEELKRIFPDSKVRVFVGTWNMNGQNPPENIDDFLLPLDAPYVPDIYAVGIQEGMQSRSEWEILLQTTLGPMHVLFASASFGVLHLSIFMRRDLIWFCSEPEEASIATRPGSMIKTKGAVAICFLFFGTSLLFVNSHLTAHEQNLKERISDIEKICSSLDLPKFLPLKHKQKSKDVTSRFDCVFWCGDLNFRVARDRSSVMSFVEEKVKLPDSSQNLLLDHDQLSHAMAKGITFPDFKEGVINFIPSYKFSIGTSCFDSHKQRVPSYTDRILYRFKQPSSIVCLHYDAVPEISTSDHKPVFGIFDVLVQPGRDNIPLAAGLFKRNVYLEAIKRRALQLEFTRNCKQSTICSIM